MGKKEELKDMIDSLDESTLEKICVLLRGDGGEAQKKEMVDFFFSQFNGSTVKLIEDIIRYYSPSGDFLFALDNKNKKFYVSYSKVGLIYESKFNYYQINELFNNILVEHLKLEGFTIRCF